MKRSLPDGFDAHCFLLAPWCYLVRGARRGALYDLKRGDVFSMDEASSQVLEACETGRSLVEVAAQVGGVDPRELAARLEPVAAAGLGAFYALPAPFVEKVQPMLTGDQQRRRRQPTAVSYAFLELTTECDLDCSFCRPGELAVRRRTGCARWHGLGSGAGRLGEEEWLDVVDDLARLHCPAVHFMGGEPLLAGGLLAVLITRLRERSTPGIYLSTNTLALDAERIELLARHGVQVIIQVFSHRPEVHDRITGRPGSHAILMARLAELRRAGVGMAFNLVLTRETVGDREETLHSLAAFEPRQVSVDAVRPARPGEPVDPELVPHLFRCQPQFAPTGAATFFQRRDGHACWLGKLAVTATGDVLPCIVARSERIGNVREKSLKEMYRDGDFHDWWRLTADQIDGCSGCEFRYACFDCRPLACALGGQRTARDPFCTYDPRAGEWRQPQARL